MVAALVAIVTAVTAVAEALLLIGGAVAIFELLFDPKGKQKVANFVANFIGGALGIAVPLLADLEGQLAPIARAFVTSLETNGAGLMDIFKDPAKTIALNSWFDTELALLKNLPPTPDGAPAQAAIAIGEAFSKGIASHSVAALFEAAFPEKLNFLAAAGPILAEMAGFPEVVKAARDPLYKNAFGAGLEYYYKSVFKPEFADEADAVQWHSRRLLSDADLSEVFKYSGLRAKYEPAFIASAYRSVQPRAVASLVQDVEFPTAQMRDLLEFAGLRDADIAFLLPLMEENSVKNVRNQYLSAIVRAAEMGTIDDTTLDSHLDSLNFSDKAKNYVHLTVAVKRLEQLAELYRKSVTALYETNQLTDAQYVPALQAIGIAEADANAHYAVDSARLRGRQLLAQERELAREQGKLIALGVETTSALYLAGQLDDAAMATAIAASGLPLELVPGVVGHLTAQRLARRVDAFGRLLDRGSAELLTEKVHALKEQVVKKLVTIDFASSTLESFEIPPATRDALLSAWAAQALKTVLPV